MFINVLKESIVCLDEKETNACTDIAQCARIQHIIINWANLNSFDKHRFDHPHSSLDVLHNELLHFSMQTSIVRGRSQLNEYKKKKRTSINLINHCLSAFFVCLRTIGSLGKGCKKSVFKIILIMNRLEFFVISTRSIGQRSTYTYNEITFIIKIKNTLVRQLKQE